jgi:hypothetical protein
VKTTPVGRLPVDIRLVGPECRHFKWVSVVNHEHDSKLHADAFRSWKNPDDLLRRRARCDVVIRRLDFQHHVAHTSAA